MPPFYIYGAALALVFVNPVLCSEICLDGTILLCSDGTHPRCQQSGAPPASSCPKACDPHINTCHATAPTCIFPDPKVTLPRGACACRPGYKATGHANSDSSTQWRLPVIGHEHRVWVAEGVPCDTLCDTSSGGNICQEVLLIGKDCIGDGRNASFQPAADVPCSYSNYSRTLSTPSTETATESVDELGDSAGATPEGLDFDDDDDDDEDDDDAVKDSSSDLDEDSSNTLTTSNSHDTFDDESTTSVDDLDEDELTSQTASSKEATPVPFIHSTDPESFDTEASNSKSSQTETSDFDEEPSATETLNLSSDDLPTEEDATFSDEDSPSSPDTTAEPIVAARNAGNKNKARHHWARVAQEKGTVEWTQAWLKHLQSLTKQAPSVDMVRHQKLCPEVVHSVISSCKKGVRTQEAWCERTENDQISRCKQSVRDKIDKCKEKEWIPGGCEAKYRSELSKCKTDRITIPQCEVGKLNAGCCDSLKDRAQDLCSAGFSVKSIRKQVLSAQQQCSVTSTLAKAAMKSYLSGQAIDFMVQLESVKTIGKTIPIIRKAEKMREKLEKWAAGLEAAADGRLQDAQSALDSLAPQIQAATSKATTYAEAAQAVVTKDVDRLLGKVANAVGELEAIWAAKGSIKALSTVADDIKAIQTAAKQCAQVPDKFQPKEFSGWKSVRSEEEVDAAVIAFKKKFEKPLYAAARCQAVLTRVERLLK